MAADRPPLAWHRGRVPTSDIPLPTTTSLDRQHVAIRRQRPEVLGNRVSSSSANSRSSPIAGRTWSRISRACYGSSWHARHRPASSLAMAFWNSPTRPTNSSRASRASGLRRRRLRARRPTSANSVWCRIAAGRIMRLGDADHHLGLDVDLLDVLLQEDVRSAIATLALLSTPYFLNRSTSSSP